MSRFEATSMASPANIEILVRNRNACEEAKKILVTSSTVTFFQFFLFRSVKY